MFSLKAIHIVLYTHIYTYIHIVKANVNIIPSTTSPTLRKSPVPKLQAARHECTDLSFPVHAALPEATHLHSPKKHQEDVR